MNDAGIPPPLSSDGSGPESVESVEAVFERTHHGLVRLAGLLAGNPDVGADLAAEAFAGFIAASRRDPVRNADAYLRKAVLNGAIGQGRRRTIRRRHAHRIGSDPVARDRTGQIDAQLIMWDALQHLSARQRAVLVLRYYEDLPITEVAEHLEMPVGTVKSTTSRALSRLEAELPGEVQ